MTALRAIDEPIPVHLTSRELRALEMLAEGHETADIARALGYAHTSARHLVDIVRMKLGAANRAQAIHEAHRRGLLGTTEVSESTGRFIAAMRAHIEKLERENSELRSREARALQILLGRG